jgi:hypothetical protein
MKSTKISPLQVKLCMTTGPDMTPPRIKSIHKNNKSTKKETTYSYRPW